MNGVVNAQAVGAVGGKLIPLQTLQIPRVGFHEAQVDARQSRRGGLGDFQRFGASVDADDRASESPLLGLLDQELRHQPRPRGEIDVHEGIRHMAE